ncbi:MAG TPA: hypothetical protein VFU74_19095 [Actinocrinis sp.]|nr:hypothetical protein [Actinocrinis sp.]
MRPVVIADFNSPLCYLAGLWVDQRLADGVEVDWRAVEHAPGLSALGVPAAVAPAFLRELAGAARLPVPPGADELPTDLPQIITNTRAAVAAYAEAVTDGVQDEIRRRLLHAIWIEKRNLSSAYEVRRIITDVMWPRVPFGPYRSTTLPRPMSGDPDPWKATRRQGGTIAPDGGPLTTVGYRRIRTWREEWRALGRPRLPVLIDPQGAFYEAEDAVLTLAGRAPRPGPIRREGVRPGEPVADRTMASSFH